MLKAYLIVGFKSFVRFLHLVSNSLTPLIVCLCGTVGEGAHVGEEQHVNSVGR